MGWMNDVAGSGEIGDSKRSNYRRDEVGESWL